ncbi:MAG: signal recognition particle-docking protein FtsY [Candidatus Aminicenantes bacterium RBG_13_63_10]|nr:MAG: signal recognition particle-docking protein FtsY [Candidatus Aminicenantes bacterium RBG_13_63_10]
MLGTLREKLGRTRQAIRQKLEGLLRSDKSQAEILTELEETLILADVSLATVEKIMDRMRRGSRKTDGFPVLEGLLKEELVALLSQHDPAFRLDASPSVALMVGVNGGGKTTSMAKLARLLQARNKRVIMAAADTFRAAAQEQLALWGKRLGIPVIRGQYGADPASVVFDAVQSLKAQQLQVLLVDTAGRVHTNANLMTELEKIKRIIAREIPGAPQEILLVLDATIGQNALVQAKEFLKFSGISGIFLTKLDGTAKGGSVLSIVDELHLPIKFLGTGETEQDLEVFSPREFVEALLT